MCVVHHSSVARFNVSPNMISEEILVTIVMVRHIASSIGISGLLPLAVLMTFITMRVQSFGNNVSAWRKRKTLPVARVAPALICRARPGFD